MQRVIFSLLFIFLIWRIFLLIPLVVGDTYISYRAGFDYTNIWKFTKSYKPVSNILLYPWANFDGAHYLTIASNGYNRENAGFLPVFPAFIRTVSAVFGQGEAFGGVQFFSAFFIANISFLFSLIFLYKLLRFDYSFRVAISTLIFLLVFPTSFYFGSIYAESVFLLLVFMSFYFARKKRWFMAALCGMFLGITKIVGISIFPALLYELYIQEKTIKTRKVIPLLYIPIGIISYGIYNLMQWGSFFHFLQAHGTLGNSRSTDAIILFPQTIFRYIKILILVSPHVYEWWIAFFEFAIFFFAVILLYIAWKKRIRLSYLIFAIIAFFIPISSGTFSGLPRYVIVLFPLFLALALIKQKWIQILYVVSGIILSFLLLMFFSRGYFVA